MENESQEMFVETETKRKSEIVAGPEICTSNISDPDSVYEFQHLTIPQWEADLFRKAWLRPAPKNFHISHIGE